MNGWNRVAAMLLVYIGAALALLLWPSGQVMQGPALTDLAPESIDVIRIERDRRLTLSLSRTGDDWQLGHPLQAAAEPRRVAPLLAIATAPVLHRLSAADSADGARYGLAPARTVLQLGELRFGFGDREPSQRGRYVLHGEQVVVIDDLYYQLLTLPPAHFVARGDTR